jgi:hypothetical protein
LIDGSPELAREIAVELARTLEQLEQRIPRGRLTASELSEIVRYRDTAHFVGAVFEAGVGWVSLGQADAWLLPPTGRNVHVLTTSDPITALKPYLPLLTCCAVAAEPTLRERLRRAAPGARLCRFGEMQSPPFDGPVDRREL